MKAKRFLMIGALSTVSFMGNSQIATHVHDWSLTRGASGYESGEGIVASNDGFIYSTGVFEQTVDFHPFSAVGSVSSNGSKDIYICKRDEAGHFVWVKSFGGDSYDDVIAIDIDSESNIYITGRFYGTVDFNPSPTISFNMTQSGGLFADVYISKFDLDGNFIWAKRLDGSNVLESTDITIDDRNDVHVTGSFRGQVDVNPSPSIFGVQLLTSSGSGDEDGFSVTLDQNGIYSKSYHLKGNSSNVSINSVALDEAYNQYFTGEFTGTCDFDHGTPVTNLTSTGSSTDAFVMRVDPFNGFQTVVQLESSISAHPKSIKLDANKNVYTMGTFSGNIDLNPNSGVDMHSTLPTRTGVYVSKLYLGFGYSYGESISGSGSLLTKGNVYGKNLHVTPNGKTYFTGSFTKKVDFNPGSGYNNITAVGIEDAFICGLTSSGGFWMTKTIEPHYSYGYAKNNAITLNSGEDIFTTGNFTDMADFNPSGYPYYGISLGGVDMFTHKLKKIQPIFNPFFKSNEVVSERVKINAYPNPTSSLLNLTVTGEKTAQITMYSMNGQVVYSGTHNVGHSSISMNNLSEGVYILQIKQGEYSERIKVIKE